MKIAIYVPSWPPGRTASGIVTYASQIVPALRDLGHDVFIITPGKSDDDPRTIDLTAFSQSPSIWARAIDKLIPGTAAWRSVAFAIRSAVVHLMREHRIDLFEIEETFGLNLPISRTRLLPVVVRLHGPWFLTGAHKQNRQSRSDRLRQKWEGAGMKNATLISAPSKEILRAVRSHYGFSLPDVCVVPNALQSADSQSSWHFNNCDENNILFVGRFDRQKGGDLVLRVFAELAAIHPKLTLTFVGPDFGVNGPDNKLHSFQSYLQSTLPEQYGSKIAFCGQVPHAELISLRRKSFLTIVASQYETMPYAVLEPMALGCPIVATRVGGIPEMIRDGRNGLLVPSQDAKRMADACSRIINNPAIGASLGHQAWNDCRKFYDPTVVAAQTVRGYQDAAARFNSQAN